MLGKDGFFEKRIIPLLLGIAFGFGLKYLIGGDFIVGSYYMLVVLYMGLQFRIQREGEMPKWAFISMIILTVLSVIMTVVIIQVGENFSLLVIIVFIIGGLVTMFEYYEGDKKDGKVR